MSVDSKIIEAVKEAVAANGQSQSLARKINALLESISSGNSSLDDKQTIDRHLELLYQATDVDNKNEALI